MRLDRRPFTNTIRTSDVTALSCGGCTSLEKEMDGAALHSLARKKFPYETVFSPNWTVNAVEGTRSGERRGCRSGVRRPD